MKNTILTNLMTLFAFACLFGQPNANDFLNAVPLSGKAFSECSAIFLKGEMLVSEYSPKGTCKIEKGMKGKLTLSAVELNDGGGKAIRNLPFKIALKDKETGTILMISDKDREEIMIEDILPQCKKGDKIMILTVDPAYSLPHNEIEVVEGC